VQAPANPVSRAHYWQWQQYFAVSPLQNPALQEKSAQPIHFKTASRRQKSLGWLPLQRGSTSSAADRHTRYSGSPIAQVYETDPSRKNLIVSCHALVCSTSVVRNACSPLRRRSFQGGFSAYLVFKAAPPAATRAGAALVCAIAAGITSSLSASVCLPAFFNLLQCPVKARRALCSIMKLSPRLPRGNSTTKHPALNLLPVRAGETLAVRVIAAGWVVRPCGRYA